MNEGGDTVIFVPIGEILQLSENPERASRWYSWRAVLSDDGKKSVVASSWAAMWGKSNVVSKEFLTSNRISNVHLPAQRIEAGPFDSSRSHRSVAMKHEHPTRRVMEHPTRRDVDTHTA